MGIYVQLRHRQHDGVALQLYHPNCDIKAQFTCLRLHSVYNLVKLNDKIFE